MTQATVLVGTVDYPVAKKTVHRELDAVELSATYAVPVKVATARKWRKESGTATSFCPQAPKHIFEPLPAGAPFPGDPKKYGGFAVTDENVQLFCDFMKVAAALDAPSIVFLTPASFTPSHGNLAAMTGFLAAVRDGNQSSQPAFVWEPRGPWELSEAARFAAQQDLILAVDPLRDEPPPGDVAYFRLGPFAAMGSRMGRFDLERIQTAAAPFSRVTCVFQTQRALDDARNLKKVMAGEFLKDEWAR